MKDAASVEFLQWALPQLQMRWRGFRKVRRQVLKRIRSRVAALGLMDLAGYRRFLETHPDEWPHLGELCRVTISRFGRDRGVFDHLRSDIMPRLAHSCSERAAKRLSVWSAGCASGEEPYSVSLTWRLHLSAQFPDLELRILATDSDPRVLERARAGVYPRSSLRELSPEDVAAAFDDAPDGFRLRPELKNPVELRLQDIRTAWPDERFDLILCRNLVLTYFDSTLARRVISRVVERLHPGGVLLIGVHEVLPDGIPRMIEVPGLRGCWQRK